MTFALVAILGVSGLPGASGPIEATARQSAGFDLARLDRIDAAIDTLKQFADAGLTEIALRVHDEPADAIRLIGERVWPELQ